MEAKWAHCCVCPFLKDFGWKFVKAIPLISKTCVTALRPLGLVTLLQPAAVLRLLGTHSLPREELASQPGLVGSVSLSVLTAESPLLYYPGSAVPCSGVAGPSASLHRSQGRGPVSSQLPLSIVGRMVCQRPP